MAIVVNTKTYTADIASGPNSQPYFGPNNSLSVKDRIDLYRTYPKATKEFSGMARFSVKTTRTLNLTGAVTATGDAILKTDGAFPVGASNPDIASMMDDHGDLLISAGAIELAQKLDLII